ncbi:MAG: hypothetical protein HKL90_03375, partial [Elusimicrobia bacterium]|nr:hypothetical protein [Elusimicrobiota bacterium]
TPSMQSRLSSPGLYTGMFSIDFSSLPAGGQLNGSVVTTYNSPTVNSQVTGLADGSYTSPIYDITQSSGLPGSMIRVGVFTDPVQNVISTYTAYALGAGFGASLISGPVGNLYTSVSLLSAEIDVITGNKPDLSDGVSAVLYKNASLPMACDSFGLNCVGDLYLGSGQLAPSVSTARVLQRYFRLTISVSPDVDENAIAECAQYASDGMTCLQGHPLVPVIAAFGGEIFGLQTFQFSGPQTSFQFEPGLNQSAAVAAGLSISGLDVTAPGSLSVTVGGVRPDPGYWAASGSAFKFTDAPFYVPPMNVSMNFSTFGLSAGQAKFARIVTEDASGNLSAPLAASVSGDTVTFPIDPTQAPVTVTMLAPRAQNPVYLQAGTASFLYDGTLNAPVSLQAASASPVLSVLLASAAAQGLMPLSTVVALSVSSSTIYGANSIQISYTPQAGLTTVALYQLTLGSPPRRAADQFAGYQYSAVSAGLGAGAGGYYAVFGSSIVPQAPDITPPVTSIQFASLISSAPGGAYMIASGAQISLSAVDPTVPGVLTSGVAATYYGVDVNPLSPACQSVAFSSSAPAGTCADDVYAGPFSVDGGTHTIFYFSKDYAGNVESLKQASVTVVSTAATGGSGFKGLAIAADANGTLWEVADADGKIYVGRYTQSNGVALPLSSAKLGPDPQVGNWSLQFDASGNAYAIGDSSAGIAAAATVYELNSSGVPISSAAFVASGGAAALIFGSDAKLWETGVIATGSPGQPGFSAELALWHYAPAGSLTLAATYGGGAAVAAGLAAGLLDGDSYVVGYAGSASSSTLALSLWRFDGGTGALKAGPFAVTDFLALSSGTTNLGAALAISSGSAFAFGQRTGAAGESDLELAVFDAFGRIMVDRYETAGPGASLLPRAAVDGPGGGVDVLVQAQTSAGPAFGVARYGPSGNFLGAATDGQSEGAHGLAAAGGRLWVAVDGSTTPYAFAAAKAVTLQDVFVSSAPADVLPPRTSLAIGAPSVAESSFTFISTTTPLSLSAVDDAVTVGDGAGVGVAATYVAVDTAAFSVYAGSFTITVPGPHSVNFYSVDRDSHVEVAHSSAVYVDIAPPGFAFAPSSGSFVDVSTPTLTVAYFASDGVSTATVRLALDGAAVTTNVVVTASSATFVPQYALSQGTHTFSAAAADELGHL